MTLASLLNRPCTITRRSAGTVEDAYGDLIPVETDVDTVCEVQQIRRDEPPAAGELSITTWLIFFPIGTVLDTSDAVTIDGYGTFELIGDPWVADTGSVAVHHVEATAKRIGPDEDGS